MYTDSNANAGCFFGAIIMLVIGDRLGRKKGIIAGAIIMIVGVVIQVSAVKPYNHMAQFIIGRTITGVGNGMNTSTIPVRLHTILASTGTSFPYDSGPRLASRT